MNEAIHLIINHIRRRENLDISIWKTVFIKIKALMNIINNHLPQILM